MKYRKFRGEAIFTGSEMLGNDRVLVTDENGSVQEIISAEDAGDAEYLAGIISPGFVNAHCHLELSWMEGLIPRGTGMIDFLLAVMKTPKAGSEAILAAIAKNEQEMIGKGIIAVGDICNTSLTLATKREGNLYYHNFIEAMGFVEASAEQRFDQALQVFNEFAAEYPLPVANNSIVPHSPYSVSKKLFQKIVNHPGNQLLSIHNQEHAAENEFFLEGSGDFHRLFNAIGVDSSFHKASGTSSLRHFLQWFKKNQTLLLVHNVETSAEDLNLIRESRASGADCWLCLCPNANIYINGKLPNLALLASYADSIVLGTDSLASNTSLDILEEIKTLHTNFPAVPVAELLRWATRNGATALGIEAEAGSFEKGKSPGIVLINGADKNTLSNSAFAQRIL